MENEQEFPQDDANLPEPNDAIEQLFMELENEQPAGQWNDDFANPPDLVFNMDDYLKTKLLFTEQEIQQFLNSPECALYWKLTSSMHVSHSTLRAFIVKNYKPYIKNAIRLLHRHGYDGTHYIHYDGQILDDFFADENILQTIANIENVNLRDMLKYYLYATTYGIILTDNVYHYRDEMCDFIHNKELAHGYFCTYSVYFNFCKNCQLQRRAIISIIHENANSTSTTCKTIHVFADEYIFSKILDFF